MNIELNMRVIGQGVEGVDDFLNEWETYSRKTEAQVSDIRCLQKKTFNHNNKNFANLYYTLHLLDFVA